LYIIAKSMGAGGRGTGASQALAPPLKFEEKIKVEKRRKCTRN
jgi:hypothetical protein